MKSILTILLLIFVVQANCHTPVWTKDIAPILFKHCTSCHHDNGLAPFSLVTYEEAFVNRFSIEYSVKALRMPPWHADPTYSHFTNEQVLTANEIHLIEEWARSSAPYGRPEDAPTPPVYTNAPSIGKYDLEISIPEYTVTTNSDVYRCFPVKTNLTVDQFITAFECIPGNTNIVHHVLVYADTSDVPNKLDVADSEPGYINYWGVGSESAKQIGSWVPGSDATFYPTNMGQFLSKKATIILQVHYAPGSLGQKDKTRFLAKLNSRKLRELKTEPLLNHFATGLFLPANKVTTVNNAVQIKSKITMISVLPHMHSIGKSIKVWKDTTKIIRINDWNFHWQRTYNFKKPIVVSPNDILQCSATFDNKTNRDVRDGVSSNDEMMMVYFTYTDYQKGDEQLNLAPDIKTSTLELTKLNLTCSPNPVTDQFSISDCEGKVDVFDVTGRLIKTSYSTQNVDVSDLSPGSYFVTVRSKDEYGYIKLIKL